MTEKQFDLLDQARKFLNSAYHLAEENMARGAVNRTYDAIMLIVRAYCIEELTPEFDDNKAIASYISNHAEGDDKLVGFVELVNKIRDLRNGLRDGKIKDVDVEQAKEIIKQGEAFHVAASNGL